MASTTQRSTYEGPQDNRKANDKTIRRLMNRWYDCDYIMKASAGKFNHPHSPLSPHLLLNETHHRKKTALSLMKMKSKNWSRWPAEWPHNGAMFLRSSSTESRFYVDPRNRVHLAAGMQTELPFYTDNHQGSAFIPLRLRNGCHHKSLPKSLICYPALLHI